MNLQSLRRHIGVVLQTSRLFTGTLFSNVAVTAATLTEEQVWKLFEQVGLADDVHAMPMGLYTQVTEGGGGLSSGQMQRVLIARALAVNPALLIFDEATSALDNVTQRIVTDSLDHLQCTKIVIAHRLSTVKNCDRILVFDNGKVVENGTFDELMALNGYFCELVKRQL
jgi:ABC-type bacteriocin/lantibiotic exporter with double-glycine peptidase domain